jgi:hypothetical protein
MTKPQALFERESLTLRNDQHSSRQTQDHAANMVEAQPFSRQQGRKHHEEQWSEIGDQAGFNGRRRANGGEVYEVVAKQPANADKPYSPVLLE